MAPAVCRRWRATAAAAVAACCRHRAPLRAAQAETAAEETAELLAWGCWGREGAPAALWAAGCDARRSDYLDRPTVAGEWGRGGRVGIAGRVGGAAERGGGNRFGGGGGGGKNQADRGAGIRALLWRVARLERGRGVAGGAGGGDRGGHLRAGGGARLVWVAAAAAVSWAVVRRAVVRRGKTMYGGEVGWGLAAADGMGWIEVTVCRGEECRWCAGLADGVCSLLRGSC